MYQLLQAENFEASDGFTHEEEFWSEQEPDNAQQHTWETIKDNFDNAQVDLSYAVDEGLSIYRIVSAKNIRDIRLGDIGIFWSYGESTAEAHWGNFNAGFKQYLITGRVEPEYVDWETTLRMNLDPSSSIEKEIRLFNGSPITIISIQGPDEMMDQPQSAKALQNPT